MNAQATIESDFQLPPLWAHQTKALNLYKDKPAWLHLWEPRVGKTRVTIEQMKYWITDRSVRKVVIVASKLICQEVWEPEIRLAYQANNGTVKPNIVNLYNGTTSSRKALIDKIKRGGSFLLESNFQPLIVVVNYEALRYFKDELAAIGFDALIADEIHRHKTPSSERHKAVLKLRKGCKFFRGLSGTLTTKDYADIYGIYKIADPNIFGTNKENFLERYCIMDRFYPSKIVSYTDKFPELQEKIFSIADVVRKKDCFDLPIRQDVFRKIQLSKGVKALYDDIAKNHTITSGSESYSLDHALSRLTYLLQFSSGNLPNRGEIKDIDNKHVGWKIEGKWFHNEKLNACIEEVEDIVASGQKVVIFHHFKEEARHILDALGSKYTAQISSDVRGSRRSEIIDSFNNKEFPKTLVIQEDIGSEGISLRGANYAIFYSCGLSWATHEQARERTFKPGSDNKLTYIYLQCVGTADTWATRIIKQQRNVAEALLRTSPEEFEDILVGK